jgi:outer membrane protein
VKNALFLLFFLVGSFGYAQLSLVQALAQSLANSPEMRIARANLAQAQALRKAQEADPSSPEDLLVRVRNADHLAGVRLEQTKLENLQNVLGVYLGIAEVQQSLELLGAQIILNTQSLEVAKSRLANKVGTPLEVSRAENAILVSQQQVKNTQSQLLVLSSRLRALLGLETAVEVSPSLKPLQQTAQQLLTVDLKAPNNLLSLPTIVEAQNGLTEAQLAVKLTDNDYTPELTKRETLTALSNAQLGLRATQQAAATSLADTLRAALDAKEQVQFKDRDLANTTESHRQSQIRLKAGIISGLQLQSSELELRSARFQLLQAQLSYLRALAALSVAAGIDVTGLTKGVVK